ncbi:LOW QUALITY PROTEIN: uncharacterized homolog [Canis lupus baileyi]|uniref:LOW QUALITY PROTEIN: uncharacterized homolog n=1 Tax=Canis lupus baileyi TaxID=143281 RepID=UPI003B97A851
MAGSQLPPPLLLLALVLLVGNFSSQTPPEQTQWSGAPSSGEDSMISHRSSSSEANPTIQPSSSSTSPGLAPTFPQPETVTPPSSGSPSSELTTTSHSANSTTLTLHWSSSSPSPRTEPRSMPSNTTDGTSVATGPGSCKPKLIFCPSPTRVISMGLRRRGAWMEQAHLGGASLARIKPLLFLCGLLSHGLL